MGGFTPTIDTGGNGQNSLADSKGLTTSDNKHSLSNIIESGRDNLLRKYVIYLGLSAWDPTYKHEIKVALTEFDENSQKEIIEKGIEYIAKDVLDGRMPFKRGYSSIRYLVTLLSDFSGQNPNQIKQNLLEKCFNNLRNLKNTIPLDEVKSNIAKTIIKLISFDYNTSLVVSSVEYNNNSPRIIALRILHYFKTQSKKYTSHIENNVNPLEQDNNNDDGYNTEDFEIEFSNEFEDLLEVLDNNGGSRNSVIRELSLLTVNLLNQGKRSSLKKIVGFMDMIKERVNTSTTLEMIYVVITDTLNRKDRAIAKTKKPFETESSTSLVSVIEFNDSKSALEYFISQMTNNEKRVYMRAIDRFTNNYLYENNLDSSDETITRVNSIINQAFFTGFSKASLYEEGKFRVDRITKTEGSINKIIRKGLTERNNKVKDLVSRVKRMSTPHEVSSEFYDLGIESIRGGFYYQNIVSGEGLNDLLSKLGKPELMTITEATQLDEQLTYLENRIVQSAIGIATSTNLIEKNKITEIINSPQIAAQVIRGFCLEFLNVKYLGKTINPLALPIDSINDIASMIGDEANNYLSRKQTIIELGSTDLAGKIVSYLSLNTTFNYRESLFDEIRDNVEVFFQQTFSLIEQYKRNLENTEIDSNTKLTNQQRIITNFPNLFPSLSDEITLYPDQNRDVRLSIWKDSHNIDESIVPTSIGLKQIIDIIQIVDFDDASKKKIELPRLYGLYFEALSYEQTVSKSQKQIAIYEKAIEDLSNPSTACYSSRKGHINKDLLSTEESSTLSLLSNELFEIKEYSMSVRHEIAGKERFDKKQESIKKTGIVDKVISQAIYLIQPFETKLIIWKEIVSKIYETSHKRERPTYREKSLRLISEIFEKPSLGQNTSAPEVYKELIETYNTLISFEANAETKISELLRLKQDKISELIHHYVLTYSSKTYASQYALDQRLREIDSFSNLNDSNKRGKIQNIIINNLVKGIKSDLDYYKILGDFAVKDSIMERMHEGTDPISEQDLELLGTPSVAMLHKLYGIYPLIEKEEIKSKAQEVNELLDLMENYSTGFYGEHTYVLSNLVNNDDTKTEDVMASKRHFGDNCKINNLEEIDSLFSTVIQKFNSIFGEEQTRTIFSDTSDQEVYSNLRLLFVYTTLNITVKELNEDVKTRRQSIYEKLGRLKRKASILQHSNGIIRERANITNSGIKYVDFCKRENAVFSPPQKVLE